MTDGPSTEHPADGTAETRDGRRILRFERRLAHPLHRVWAAVTDPVELRGWLADADLALEPGGAVELRWLNTDDEGRHAVMRGRITQLDPPRLLEIDSDIHGVLRFELREEGPDTVLAFTVTLPDEADLGLVLPGWHIHLEHLADALDGRPVDWAAWDKRHRPRWRALHDEYVARAR